MALKIRRGLEADRLSVTPEEGEFLYVTDTSLVYIGDGLTAGGNLIAGGGGIDTATASGTNTYTATITGVTAYATHDIYEIIFTNANTGSSTININSLGAKTLKKEVSTNLASGDIPAGKSYFIVYDGTNFQVIGISSGGTAATTSFTPAGNIAATDVQSAIEELDTEKQAALGFTPENVANKDTDGTLAANSDTKYASQKAVKTFAEAKRDEAKAYADSLVVGLWDDRGNYDASGGAYPSSGGSGTAGAIKKGDIWTISVAGTLPTGQVVEVGDTVRALVDTPGNTQANWSIQQNNIGYTAENTANKSTDGTFASPSNTTYPTTQAVKTGLDTKSSKTEVQNSGLTSASASGIDTYAASLSPALTAYVKGQRFELTDAVANTVTNPTLNVNGLGAKNLLNYKGAALGVGDFQGTVIVMYDGTAFRMVGGGGSGGGTADVRIRIAISQVNYLMTR